MTENYPPIDGTNTKAIAPAWRVLPCASSWFHDDLTVDYKAGARVWREISEKDFRYCLEVLPPIALSGFREFMVSEPHSHDDHGRPVYCACVKIGTDAVGGVKYYARYCSVRAFKDGDRDGLAQALGHGGAR